MKCVVCGKEVIKPRKNGTCGKQCYYKKWYQENRDELTIKQKERRFGNVRKKTSIYAVYDMKDYGICVGVFDSCQEVADYFGTTKQLIWEGVCRKTLRQYRYEIVRIKEEGED